MNDLISGLSGINWDFAEAVPAKGLHSLHSYPAKFIPEIPAALIELLTVPGDLVMDPFLGGGTTGVEALRLRRRFIGIDANPFAVLLSSVKLRGLDARTSKQLREHLEGIIATEINREAVDAWRPKIPNLEKWYKPEVFSQLAGLRARVLCLSSQAAKDIAMLGLASVAAKLSFQESETRYVSSPRSMERNVAIRTYKAEILRLTRLLSSAPADKRDYVALADARSTEGYERIADHSVKAVITSPPYPNTYDYHLYHRFRLFWLGADPGHFRTQEIGSHLKNQRDSHPMETYSEDIRSVLSQLRRVLSDDGHLAMIVGSGMHRGKIFDTASEIEAIAQNEGYVKVARIDRRLPQRRRSVTSLGRRLTEEQIVVFRIDRGSSGHQKRRPQRVQMVPPTYALHPYEENLLRMEVRALTRGGELNSSLEVTTTQVEALQNVAFAHGVRADRKIFPTFQQLSESVSGAGRAKNSTYGPHGIHRYKGKFYPQLAKSLINCSESRDGVILDPFGGSGTVAVEALLAGRRVVSIDSNPLAVAIARAKITVLSRNPTEVSEYLSRLREQAERSSPDSSAHYLSEFHPDVVEEVQSWFPKRVLRKLNSLLEVIGSEKSAEFRNVGQVLLSDIVREISHQEPRDLRIRRRKEPLFDAPVKKLFLDRIDSLSQKLRVVWSVSYPLQPQSGSASIILGDSSASTFGDFVSEPISVVVTSPPYGTALPYLDTDRLSLAAIFGHSVDSRKVLERQLIGSREITKAELKIWNEKIGNGDGSIDLPSPTIDFLQKLQVALASDPTAGFRKLQTPAVLARYFVSMKNVFENVLSSVVKGGEIWMVLGDSQTSVGGRRLGIPTVKHVGLIAVSRGLKLVQEVPISVTREDVIHSRNSITRNSIVHFRY